MKKINLVSLQGRNKQILANTAISFIIKGFSMFLALFTMPAYIRYFEDQKVLGLWFTILSVLTWILSFDLGIGNGLRNCLVAPLEIGDAKKTKEYISSSYLMAGIIVVMALLIGNLVFPLCNWNVIFNIEAGIISKEVLLKTVQLIFTGIAFQFLFNLINSILYAMQKSFLPGLMSVITNGFMLLFVLLAPSHDAETNLLVLAKMNILATNLPLLIMTVGLFLTKLRPSIPSIKCCHVKIMRKIMSLGAAFLWLQVTFMLISSTNEFLISWIFGPEQVVEYQVYNRLFALVGTIFSLALTPIWSAVTQAVAQNDLRWIKKLYEKLRIMFVFAVACEILLVPCLQLVVNLWLGENTIEVNYVYAGIFALSGSVFIWHNIITSITNGMGKLKLQFVVITIGAIIKIPLAFILAQAFDSWIVITVVNIIVLVPYGISQPIWFHKYFEKNV